MIARVRRRIGRHAVPRPVEEPRSEAPRRRPGRKDRGLVAIAEHVEHGCVLPPPVLHERPPVPHLVEKASRDATPAEHHHAAVRDPLVADVMFDEMKEAPREKIVGDVTRRVDDDRVGIDPADEVALTHQRVQERDLVPRDGSRGNEAMLDDDELIAVYVGVSLEGRTSDLQQPAVWPVRDRAECLRRGHPSPCRRAAVVSTT